MEKSQIQRSLAGIMERVVFGGKTRRALCYRVLHHFFESEHRRHWQWQLNGDPHFSLHDGNVFHLLEGTLGSGIYSLTRAFLTAEVIQEGDVVLDIGCGDGFYTKRFYAPRASAVDAIDIESSAIRLAATRNMDPKITYRRMDATVDPWPRANYDVIVWDGAIGHFTPDGAVRVLTRIASILKPGGIFCGSESLGLEGDDHLQHFHGLDDLRVLLEQVFPIVKIKDQSYPIKNGYKRREAYWRCSTKPIGDWN